jgi:hypothetical protein
MNDLLGSAGNQSPAQRKEEDIELGDIHIRTDATTDIQQAMQRFFKTVEEIKLELAEIKGLQHEVIEMNENGKALVKTKEVKQHQENMQVSGSAMSKSNFEICMEGGLSCEPLSMVNACAVGKSESS